ncbi:MAG: hypothetical protein JWM78_911 [Verrucomicrobiaceae bacterium]|nr:hypothetical protein [Verrucomicrobiaceae bacterium]
MQIHPTHHHPHTPIVDKYRRIRHQSEVLCETLLKEDYNLQAMPEVSPPKWHLAHTTWFFEAMLLKEFAPSHTPFNKIYETLFNSYYLNIGIPFPRERRGQLSRPTIAEVFEYRRTVDEQVLNLLEKNSSVKCEPLLERLELGLNHEQQHQELLLTDIKYNFSVNPLQPVYCESNTVNLTSSADKKLTWIDHPAGIGHVGGSSDNSFCFDNELPRHRVFLQNYSLADRPVNNGEFLAFIQDGGYQRADLWLSDGWQKITQNNWRAPLYWNYVEGHWQIYTLHGTKAINPAEPVCHISYYEADAYARWAGARLPTEAEWENAAASQKVEGHFLCDGVLHPRAPCPDMTGLRQMFGDVWEWTSSAYAPYPGFVISTGAVGEYNGKFMCNQMVLRGGSCVSEREHIRSSYRNFFYPSDRWQFSGLRLARSIT